MRAHHPHPLSELEDPQLLEEYPDAVLDRQYSSYEWLRVCSRVITDYSALGLEAALTGKPVYFYLYDVREYLQSVGLNIDPRQEISAACAESGPELKRLLSEEYDTEALEKFRDRFITIDTDHCTQKLGEYIYGTAQKIYQEISDASPEDAGEGA